jgi:hypothetical protein
MFDGHVVRFSTTKDRRKYRKFVARRRPADDRGCAPQQPVDRYVEVRGRALLEDDDDQPPSSTRSRCAWAVDRIRSTGRVRSASP